MDDEQLKRKIAALKTEKAELTLESLDSEVRRLAKVVARIEEFLLGFGGRF